MLHHTAATAASATTVTAAGLKPDHFLSLEATFPMDLCTDCDFFWARRLPAPSATPMFSTLARHGDRIVSVERGRVLRGATLQLNASFEI
eukprot:m.26337 g.26337  ORF g.26337 m.26337 type:complete len:90 (-) comp6293_c0_seq1:75-344(-)